MMKKIISLLLLTTVCLCAHSIAQTDTAKLYFKLNIDALDHIAKRKIDSLVYSDIINGNTSLLIIGYTDFLGTEEHNKGLSERRAKSIQTYLLSLNIPENNIKLCIGKGEIDRNIKLPAGYASDRRVDIAITKLVAKKAGSPPKQIAIDKTKNPVAKTITNINVGQSIRLENIYFYLGRHIVTDESYPQLDKLFETMDENPNLKIQIEGHICCLTRGFDAEDEDTHERVLSVNRAKFIYDYLIKKGIDKERMRFKGFGRSMPLIKPEKTPEDEDKNRRVEIRVIEK